MITPVTWTHLLPEPGETPDGFVDPDTTTRTPIRADPAGISLEDAVADAADGVYRKRPGAAAAVSAWAAEDRRSAALRVHINAVYQSRDLKAPDDSPARLMPVLIGDGIAWGRSDLAWALRTADDYVLFDGAAYLLPGYMAMSLGREELSGFEPVLQAVFDRFIGERSTLLAVRKQLAELYGEALGRLNGRLPAHLLPVTDRFGRRARQRFGERLDTAEVAGLVRYAVSLAKVTPPKAWLNGLGAQASAWPVRELLECFAEQPGYPGHASDEALRGLTAMLAQDSSAEATTLLARVAVAAGSAGPKSPNYPFAPLTAAAVVAVLGGRPGGRSEEALIGLSATVGNKALLRQVHAALDRLSR